MVNDNFPRGLVPINWPDFPGHYYRVQTGVDLYLGMPCAQAASGFVGPIEVSTAGSVAILGALVGFAGTLKRGLASNQPYLKAADLTPPTPSSDTGDRFALVADSPDQEFVIQGDTSSTLFTQAAAGEAFTMLYRSAGSGNTSTGWASLEVNAGSNVTTTAASLVFLRLHDQPNTDGTENTTGNYAKMVVRILHHQKRGGLVNTPL